MKITQMIGREIYDSRGWPTIQCELFLDDSVRITAAVPAGLSRGRYEAHELRDGGKRLWGRGVTKAIENIEYIIAPEMIGKEPHIFEMDQKILELDGTPDKSHLGANATLAASMAICKAQAVNEELELYELIAYLSGSESVSLPFPLINLINGGLHASNNLQIQEFMIIPVGAANFRAAMELSVTVFHELKNVLQRHGKSVAIGDEGGYAPDMTSDLEALDMLCEALDRVELIQGRQSIIALDIAASRFYDTATKTYQWQGSRVNAEELIEWYGQLIENYPIYSIEDGLSEDDWYGWEMFTKHLEHKVQIVGDDIFATNPQRIIEGTRRQITSAVVIKPNQIGTILETLQAIRLCKNNQLNIVVSHRSGETDDTFIADLAVGASVGQIKAGGCCRSERLSKYNRILAIEDELTISLSVQ